MACHDCATVGILAAHSPEATLFDLALCVHNRASVHLQHLWAPATLIKVIHQL